MPPEKPYTELDISSLRHYQGERSYQRRLKLNMYSQLVDMHLHESTEQGIDIWTRDAMVFNMKKFNMDANLMDSMLADFEKA